jgi:hypothetical protein
LELAAAVEAATGPDEQELIHEAFRLTFPRAKVTRVPGFEHIGDGIGPYTDEHRAWQEIDKRMTKLLCAGGFLDAAMVLLPAYWVVASLESWPMRDRGGVCLREVKDFEQAGGWGFGFDETCGDARGNARTAALALTAACLRARIAK